MDSASGSATLLRLEDPHASWSAGGGSQGLPRDLIRQGTSRLRAMALLYATIFFFADVFPMLISQAGRAALVSGPVVGWLPGAVSITVGLFVAAVVASPRLSAPATAAVAVVFEIASSYGIAAAELLQPRGLDFRNANWIGLSWVSVWMLLFTMVVPASPRLSVLAALAAASSVPAIATVSMSVYPPPMALNAFQFFFVFVFPYVLVVVMAYVGSRVLFALGNEVRKARELGSYSLLERLGEGGMGEVWRARHHFLARPAAIKLIRSGGAASLVASEVIARFRREADAIASLRSPHTINLFDFGIADDGTFYYVMELLDGLDAERLVNKYGPMPPARVIHVIRQVCHSLSEAESISLVHRDIKPANIFLCRYGEDYDFVKVLDFGIAKAIQTPDVAAAGPTVAALTVEHVVRGTPAFIAPEQALGQPVDHRADIYGIGCVAYWLLTGQLVFTGNTPLQLLVQHAQATPEPPSARTEIPIPQELDAIVLACLVKDPANRPQSARELARQLDAVPVRSPWSAEQARAWWETHHPAAL